MEQEAKGGIDPIKAKALEVGIVYSINNTDGEGKRVNDIDKAIEVAKKVERYLRSEPSSLTTP